MKKILLIITMLLFIFVTACKNKSYMDNVNIQSIEILNDESSGEFLRNENFIILITLNDDNQNIRNLISVKLNDITYTAVDEGIKNITYGRTITFEIHMSVSVISEFVIHEILVNNANSKRFFIKIDDVSTLNITIKDFRLRFHYNDGSNLFFTKLINLNESFVMPDVGTELTHFEFIEWNTEPNRIGTSYSSNSTHSFSSAINDLYAIWEHTDTFYSQGLEFRLIDENIGYEVYADNNILQGNVIVPATYNDLPVIRVADEAFFENNMITTVSLPNSIIEIGEYAFYRTSRLVNVSIPSNLNSIRNFAFAYAIQIQNLYIPDNTYFIGEGVFFGWEANQTIHINNPELFSEWNPYWNVGVSSKINVTSPGDHSFFNLLHNTSNDTYSIVSNISLKGDVIIPETFRGRPITSIAVGALSNAPLMKTLYIPHTIISIDKNNFANCPLLEKIIVDQENNFFSSVDGTLFNKSQTTIIRLAPKNPFNTNFSISDTVAEINTWAFSDVNNIQELVIPKTIQFIDSQAFFGWNNQQQITMEERAVAPFNWHQNWNLGSNARVLWDFSVESPEFIFILIFNSYYAIVGLNTNFLNLTTPSTLNIPSTYLGLPVLEIHEHAIANIQSLQILNIPAAIELIYPGAIYNCRNLKEINVDSSNEYYKSIDGNLYSFDSTMLIIYAPQNPIPFSFKDQVIEIQYIAFMHANIIHLSIPSTINYIGEGAFFGFTNSQTIHFEGRYEIPLEFDLFWNAGSFAQITFEINIPPLNYTLSDDGTFYIVNGVLTNPSEIVIVNHINGIPVTHIANNAFKNNTTLRKVTIGINIVDIGANAFADTRLEEVIFLEESNLNIIRENAFKSSNLKTIILPDSLNFIELSAFEITSLSYIDVDPNNLSFTSIDGVLFSKDLNILIQFPTASSIFLESYHIFDGVTTIGDFAFKNSTLLEITMSDTVEIIGRFAFSNCMNLQQFTIGNSITTINEEAFSYSSKINHLIIPESITYIGGFAFRNWITFQKITIHRSEQFATQNFHSTWRHTVPLTIIAYIA